jgi:tRNA threonylcarbamoyladenosine biosynthesis protein TsaB
VTGILVIDTASPAGIALAFRPAPGATVETLAIRGPQDHSRQLVPSIEALCGGRLRLRAIGVVTGPGSFAGLRVGIAAAESMGLGLAVPVFGVTTFEAALEALAVESATLVHPAGRGEFVVQRFADGRAAAPPQTIPASHLAALGPFAGEGAAAHGGVEVTAEQRAAAALAVVERRLAAGERPAGIEAHYLREPNISRPKRTPLAAASRPRPGDA